MELGREFALKDQLGKALNAFNTAIKLDRRRWEAYRYRGVVYARLGKYASALGNLNVTIRHYSKCAECFYERGTVKMLSGRLDSALDDFSKCLRLDPKYTPAYSSSAGIFYRKGLYDKALDRISTALLLKPKNPEYLHNRAVIMTGLERYKEAIQDYRHVIKHNPKSGGSYNNLAWIYSTAKNPAYRDCRKAIYFARKALQVDRNAAWLDTLASAYAECGDFKKAINVESEAYKLSRPPNENFRKRIEIYKTGKTYADWRNET
jgi:tetratricopeptide (TPR) repeat protein